MQKPTLLFLGLIAVLQKSNSISMLITDIATQNTVISNSPKTIADEYQALNRHYEIVLEEIINTPIPTQEIELQKYTVNLNRLISIINRMIKNLDATPHNFHALEIFELKMQLKAFIKMRSWLKPQHITSTKGASKIN